MVSITDDSLPRGEVVKRLAFVFALGFLACTAFKPCQNVLDDKVGRGISFFWGSDYVAAITHNQRPTIAEVVKYKKCLLSKGLKPGADVERQSSKYIIQLANFGYEYGAIRRAAFSKGYTDPCGGVYYMDTGLFFGKRSGYEDYYIEEIVDGKCTTPACLEVLDNFKKTDSYRDNFIPPEKP